MLEIGSVLDGKYKILNEIGHGGMSVVYLALNERANKTWAVKEVRKDGGNDSEVVGQSLIAETEMLKKLNHSNLPSIVDVIDTDDTFIIVMDYIEGKSLQSVLNHSGAQSPENVIEWSKQLCDVLGYLHSREPAIIYRDMKPANVMLRPDGEVSLIDFGTAREYKEHNQGDTTWLGTRGYAAPEQFGGRGQTDARTDIYCLGATMYHLLTGYSPADTQFVIYPLGQLVPSFAGSGLEKVVARCCEPDPINRYQNCAELMYALEHVHDEDSKAIKERNRKWRMFIASCLVMTVGLAGLIGFGITNRVAENINYDNKLINARTIENTELKLEACTELMNIKPGKIEAYELMMQTIEDPESDSRELITSSEHKILEDVLTKHRDDFKKGNRDGYLQFQYDRGVYYFNSFTGNPIVTKGIFEEIKDESRLGEKEQKVADCLSTFCSIKSNNAVRSSNDSEESIEVRASDLAKEESEATESYLALWKKIEDLAINPRTVDENTGASWISALIYRETIKQISIYPTAYMNAGVTKEEMLAMLDTAEMYVNTAEANSNKNLINLLSEIKEEIPEARSQLKQDKKTDLGAGSAPIADGTGTYNGSNE